jgi:hypothetical protein
MRHQPGPGPPGHDARFRQCGNGPRRCRARAWRASVFPDGLQFFLDDATHGGTLG